MLPWMSGHFPYKVCGIRYISSFLMHFMVCNNCQCKHRMKFIVYSDIHSIFCREDKCYYPILQLNTIRHKASYVSVPGQILQKPALKGQLLTV